MIRKLKGRIDDEVKKYPDARAAALPSLYAAQEEFGYLGPAALEAVAEELGVSKATLKGTATFYSMFRNKQMGRHVIRICTNVACMLFGAETLVSIIGGIFNVEPGGTSPDGRFSLVISECIGACDRGPAMLVDEDEHFNLTAGSVIEILDGYK